MPKLENDQCVFYLTLYQMTTYHGFDQLLPELKKEILCYYHTDKLRLISKSWKQIIESIFIENGIQVLLSVSQLESYFRNVKPAPIFCYILQKESLACFTTSSKYALRLVLDMSGYKYQHIRFPDLNMRCNTITFETVLDKLGKISLSYKNEFYGATVLPTHQFISYILENHYLSTNMQFIHKSIQLTVDAYCEFVKNNCYKQFIVENILNDYTNANTLPN
jgi:hypothetical protein